MSQRSTGSYYTPLELAKQLVQEGHRHCPNPDLVVDMTCGDGALLEQASQLVSAPLLGVDLDQKAIRQAQDRLPKSRTQLVQGDSLIGKPWGQKGRGKVAHRERFDWPDFSTKTIWFVCNPPFMGKNTALGSFGTDYWKYLKHLYQSHGNTDICAHFLRRAASVTTRGLLSFICTNTIAQGDTRQSGLQPLLREGWEVAGASLDIPWPEAAVTVSLLHLTKNLRLGTKYWNGREVTEINSRLRPKPERPDPRPLRANEGKCYQGVIVLGTGFLLTSQEREKLIASDPRNAERIFPYLGGQEVNFDPQQNYHRYVINFGSLSLEEAKQWPDLLAIVRQKVKPERNKVNRKAMRESWWQYGERRPGLTSTLSGRWQFLRSRPALYGSLSTLNRCLVCSRISKHLIFSFQPTERVFSNALQVFPFNSHSVFSLLQSRSHEVWTWLLSSTLEKDLRYSSSDCFDTFPFPDLTPEMESIGKKTHSARARFMLKHQIGLTPTYNLLKDTECQDSPLRHSTEVQTLRNLHREMDQAVLSSYGWDDLEAPDYLEDNEEFKNEVLDRLFTLNDQRFRAENYGVLNIFGRMQENA